MECTAVEPYHEMKLRPPILWTVMKFLPGRDLLNARLIDRYWKNAVDDLLHDLQTIGKSPLKLVWFPDSQTLQLFQEAFPVPNPPDGFQFQFFHFGNLKLILGVSPLPVLQEILQVYGPHLKFVTIGIPAFTSHALQHLKVVLNNCSVLQKLSLVSRPETATLPEIEEVALGPLPSLNRIDIDCRQLPWNNFEKFLEELVEVAPNLRWTSVNYFDIPASRIPGMLRPLERTTFVKLKLAVVLEANGQQLFRELGEVNLKVWELDLTLLQMVPENLEENQSAAWLGKLDKNGLQELSIGTWNVRIHLPPVLNIRKLVNCTDFDKPLEPSQVPVLEEVTMERGYAQYTDPSNRAYPAAFGKVFPTVKKLKVHFVHGYPDTELECGFPNLESLELCSAVGGITPEGVTTLRKLFLQLPNLTRLVIIDFDSMERPGWDVFMGRIGPAQEDPWWDLFTGGILPRMNRFTELDVIYAQTPPPGELPAPSLSDLLPKLRTLELRKCPEALLFAAIHLTATERISRLDTLRFDPLREGYTEFLQQFIPMLKAYHHKFVVQI